MEKMKRISSAAVALTLLITCSTTVQADAASLNEARVLVAQTGLGKKLSSLALLTAKSTTTYAMIADKLGNASANSALSDEINALLPQYQPKWDESLAVAYEKSFSGEELSSLVAQGRASKYAAEVKERQAGIGRYMQANAQPILVALVSDALKATLSKHVQQ
ncbi:hypothetical protein LOY67_19375 [Pseudomonas sp. B21-056]|jgi:hypothetical protein|uniref:hypothetical protein n=1 Tax=Pseudomonas sp. B21-056 TaxID=2895495 RepID=UPI00222F4FD6|nr:hypothetical protein [Pseudomonas sp. B21-056]UZE22186.1 hypothetical protein LOY67_19375 [Pseudomonas sp. B21-056]